MESQSVDVDLGDRSYTVEIGFGVSGNVERYLPEKSRKVAVVTQDTIGVEIDCGDREQRVFHIGDGEEHKTISTIQTLCREWAEWGLNRNDVVVGLGGGIVTDVAGFAASVFHRGLPVIQVPTTLLGQIDAAIGGKTGVNLPEGKNLVGTYWQPLAVLCDVATLATLSDRHYKAGLGELAKYHFLDPQMTREPATLVDGRLADSDIIDRVAWSVQIKADAVSADEREGGRRALLNYGHTLGHALETFGGHKLLHGEAVGIGIAYAADVALELDRIDPARVDHHHDILAGYGLAMKPSESPRFDEIEPLLSRDKKALDGVTFILDGPNGCEVVPNVDAGALRRSYERFLA